MSTPPDCPDALSPLKLISPNLSDEPFKDLEKQMEKTKQNIEESIYLVQTNSRSEIYRMHMIAIIQQWNNLALLRHMKRIEYRVDRLAQALAGRKMEQTS